MKLSLPSNLKISTTLQKKTPNHIAHFHSYIKENTPPFHDTWNTGTESETKSIAFILKRVEYTNYPKPPINPINQKQVNQKISQTQVRKSKPQQKIRGERKE